MLKRVVFAMISCFATSVLLDFVRNVLDHVMNRPSTGFALAARPLKPPRWNKCCLNRT